MALFAVSKGTARLFGMMNVKKGERYLGFICPHCKAKICALINPDLSQEINPIAVGEGKFSVPCRECKTDEIIFQPQDLVQLVADNDGIPDPRLRRRLPSNSVRNLLKNKHKNAVPTFGIDMIEFNPECAVIFARCIAAWSYVEVAIAHVLASLLRAKSEPVLAMFTSIQNSRIQFDLLHSVASTVLDEPDMLLFKAVSRIKSQAEKERNSLAHGLLGASALIADSLMWCEQKYQAIQTATVIATDYDDMDFDRVRNNTFIYTAEDLEAIYTRFSWIRDRLTSLANYYASDDYKWRAQQYLQLCSEPRIQQEIYLIQEGQKKTP